MNGKKILRNYDHNVFNNKLLMSVSSLILSILGSQIHSYSKMWIAHIKFKKFETSFNVREILDEQNKWQCDKALMKNRNKTTFL